MSYSFNVRAASKADAVELVTTEFDKIAASQPVHASDREAAVAAAETFINLVSEPGEGQELSVSVNGWLQWQNVEVQASPPEFTGASFSIQASLVTKGV